MSNEELRQKILADAAKLEEKINRTLEETEEDDHYTLQNWHESYGETQEFARKVGEAQYRQRLRNLKRDKPFMAKLKERGLSVEKFLELEQRNPHAFSQSYDEGVNSFLDRLEGKNQKNPDAFFDPSISRKPSPERIRKAREAARRGKGDDASIDAILNALLFE